MERKRQFSIDLSKAPELAKFLREQGSKAGQDRQRTNAISGERYVSRRSLRRGLHPQD